MIQSNNIKCRKILAAAVFMVGILVLLIANTANAEKLINNKQWPKTPDLTWEIIDSNIDKVGGYLRQKKYRSAITPARNVVTGIRALQNFARLKKYREDFKDIDLAKSLTLASRMANALLKNRRKVADNTLKELRNVLRK